MNKERVLEVVKILIDECSSSSCEYCDFCNAKGDCVLADELIGAPSAIDIEKLEECKNEYTD
ncbi:MAG: hypothetical protein E7214_08250 [Clostridium sp.]|nr:hypothetical protein [Clostridium sp.]